MQNFYWSVVNSSVRETPFARLVFVLSRLVFFSVLFLSLIVAPTYLIGNFLTADEDLHIAQIVLASSAVWIVGGGMALFVFLVILAQIFKLVNYIATGTAVDDCFYTNDPYSFDTSGLDQLLEKLIYPLLSAFLSPFLFVERFIDGDWRERQAQIELAHYQEDPDYQQAIQDIEIFLKRK